MEKVERKSVALDQRKKTNVQTQILKVPLPLQTQSWSASKTLWALFEQIADMPQNRGCLSWDGVEERGERCRESLEGRGTWRGTGDEIPGNCTPRQKWKLFQMSRTNPCCPDAWQRRQAKDPNKRLQSKSPAERSQDMSNMPGTKHFSYIKEELALPRFWRKMSDGCTILWICTCIKCVVHMEFSNNTNTHTK